MSKDKITLEGSSKIKYIIRELHISYISNSIFIEEPDQGVYVRPATPCKRMETLNLDDNADGNKVGASMEARSSTASSCKGLTHFGSGIKGSGGMADGTPPPRTRAV